MFLASVPSDFEDVVDSAISVPLPSLESPRELTRTTQCFSNDRLVQRKMVVPYRDEMIRFYEGMLSESLFHERDPSTSLKHLSSDQNPGWLFDKGDEKLPTYIGMIIISHCKDPL